ncbi:V-type ATPase 116kDa subunit family protein [Sinomonas humi]|uniref:Uncharacterized protein n=1 Tax=Sinomonas humi TaxID=1338436 RepID=A0A0B2AQS4_9MICC|nr:V-type ATPase 116kDa subunit family protein [Sinomonas humi]KHL04218.1 hypothetical protein LK10_06660 [Sinomonas humi]
MSWRDRLTPLRMQRIGLVALEERLSDVLRTLARAGLVELDLPYTPGPFGKGRDEAELERALASAVRSGPLAGFAGWTPAQHLPVLQEAMAAQGAAVVPLQRPRGKAPPTLFTPRDSASAARSLVDTYGTVPYEDVDPSRLTAIAYVVMFGMMFGDVGHGLILVLAGLLMRSGKIRILAGVRKMWSFVAGAGAAAVAFGFLYGEAFGPTGVVPVLWLEPLSNPVPLLLTAIAVGGALLAIAYAIGTVNRVREGGWAQALYSRAGLAGSLLFAALGLLAWGIIAGSAPLTVSGAFTGGAALVLIFLGLFAAAGGGPEGAVEASIEVVDAVVRLGSNLVSFARLAAFGLTHAALGAVVWDGTTALWGPDLRAAGAVLLFVLGNAVSFALEALVAGVQALRLEYYELFSRIFQSEGRPFLEWAPVLSSREEDSAVRLNAGIRSGRQVN